MADGKKKIPKLSYPMPQQDPKERIKNFDEVALGYDMEVAIKEAERCLQCKREEGKEICIDGCPVEIDIPAFIKCIREKRMEDALNIIREQPHHSFLISLPQISSDLLFEIQR